jgi:hypothetical protein
MERVEAKEYSWAWVTANRLLTDRECELIYACLVPSAAGADVTLYDGENTTGDTVVTIEHAAKTSHPFNPRRPIYCRKGLYVSLGTNVTGVLVLWRHI